MINEEDMWSYALKNHDLLVIEWMIVNWHETNIS